MTSESHSLRGILRAKRDGEALSAEACAWFLRGVASGEVDEGAQAALLGSIWFNGMEPDELAGWTRGMVDSGERLDLDGIDGPKVDKHSTGGVGDKVSLPLAPALAALGCVVPMISGRGLGHTGGTLDKLEAVPGVRTGLSEDEIRSVLTDVGAVICAQTKTIAPADRKLYALRDRVELVESLPLIASSIVSKKIAEDIDALVLDVKAGSGSFLVDEDRARAVAQTMVNLAEANGVRASARLTWMGRPLGRAVGHALEIEETRATLRGEGPTDLVELVALFGSDLLVDAGLAADESTGKAQMLETLRSGAGLDRFERMLRAQGATGEAMDVAPLVHTHVAKSAGVLSFTDVREVGLAVRDLGGGRENAGDVIDPAVGIVWLASEGDALEAGQPLAEIHARDQSAAEAAERRLGAAFRLVPAEASTPPAPLLIDRVLPTS